jgi:hypothetical protein
VIRLIGIPGSHPSLTAELMIRDKGLLYRRLDLPVLARWAVNRDRAAMATFVEGARTGLPPAVVRRSLPVLGPLVRLQMRIPDAAARERLEALGRDLDEIDRLLAARVIGGAEPNAAAFQIAASVRLALCFDDLRARIDARPAGAFARRLCPIHPGRFGPVFPADWLRTIG